MCPLSAEPESKRNKLIGGLLKSSQADARNAISCCARALPVQLNIRLHEGHGSLSNAGSDLGLISHAAIKTVTLTHTIHQNTFINFTYISFQIGSKL